MIGCYDAERVKEMDLLVNLSLEADVSTAMESDSLDDTIDYAELATLCQETAQQGRYHLLEALASAIVEEIFHRYPACAVEVEIHKASALPDAQYAYVTLRREREEVPQ